MEVNYKIHLYTFVTWKMSAPFPAGERQAASLAALSPGSRLSRFPAGVSPFLAISRNFTENK